MSTVHEVARRAGVSHGTVSRVLNGAASVHPVLRRQVEDAIRELSYRPNAAARSLRRSRSDMIGAVVPEISNATSAALLDGVERVAQAHGSGLLICNSGSSEAQWHSLESLWERRVDGVILQPVGAFEEHIDPLIQSGIPVVVVGQREPHGDYPQVVVDEYEASLAAIRMLIHLGHRRVALFLGAAAASSGALSSSQKNRLCAFRQAHADAGIPLDPEQIVHVQPLESASAATRRILGRSDRPTALVAGLHTLAPPMLRAIRECGLSIPEDVSLVIYGDAPWAAAFSPPLTVVRSDYGGYGRRTAELLFALRTKAATELVLHQPAMLEQRASCAPPGRTQPKAQ